MTEYFIFHSRYRLAGNLPHILVLNKEDLVDNSEKVRIKKLLRKTDKYLSDVIFTNCKQRNNFGLSKVGPWLRFQYGKSFH